MTPALGSGPAADELLERAGVRAIRMKLPVPVPPVNVYLMGEGTLAMVDCGPLWEDGWARVLRSLEPGERVAELLVTHGHVDHHGGAARAARDLGCAVRCHAFDLPAVRDFEAVLRDRYERWSELARESGMPEPVVERMAGHYMFLNTLGEDTPGVVPLQDGATVEVGGAKLEALHVPGHTAGSMVFLERRRRVLFSGDTVLPGITPNPFFEGITDEPSGPDVFLRSIERLRELPVDLVLPGHGPPVRDLRGRLEDYERHHRARREAIARVLAERHEASAFEIVQELFPGVSQVDWWLAVAEVVGHLQQMERSGEAARGRRRGGVLFWKPGA